MRLGKSDVPRDVSEVLATGKKLLPLEELVFG
jgi:hypothetical protein